MKFKITNFPNPITRRLGIFLLIFALSGRFLAAQELQAGYIFGKSIPNHPDYPPLRGYSQGVELQYQPRLDSSSRWQQAQPLARLGFIAQFQHLGNDRVLGRAYAVMPYLSWRLLSKEGARLECRLGWGLGYLDRHFNPFSNPENVVIGSAINTCTRLDLVYNQQISEKIKLKVSFGACHYSNAGTQSPNLGVNIAQAGLGLGYQWGKTAPNKPKKALSFQTRPRPFAQIGLGWSGQGYGGAKFPIYTLLAGVSKQWKSQSRYSAGLEWLFHTGTYELQRLNAAQELPRSRFYRYCLLLQHELCLGNFGFITAGGIYLNRHPAQRSLFASKIGVNYQLRNQLKGKKPLIWVGLHVRAYFGEAEFAELVAGYRF